MGSWGNAATGFGAGGGGGGRGEWDSRTVQTDQQLLTHFNDKKTRYLKRQTVAKSTRYVDERSRQRRPQLILNNLTSKVF